VVPCERRAHNAFSNVCKFVVCLVVPPLARLGRKSGHQPQVVRMWAFDRTAMAPSMGPAPTRMNHAAKGSKLS
jgi:hypothetical protein